MKSLTVPERFQVLDGAALKWIAMASMLCDHLDKGILLNLIIIKECSHPALLFASDALSVLGRIAFPIFLFLLVEGFIYTRSRRNYCLYLLGFGLLSEIPYDMFESGVYFDFGGQNMYFTLALGLVTLCIVEKVKEKCGKVWILPAILITAVSAFVASLLALDYHYYGIIIPVVFYILRDQRIVASVLNYLVIIKELWSFLGFAILNFYNGKRGKINKWFCYAFYPGHLLVIGAIRMFILQV